MPLYMRLGPTPQKAFGAAVDKSYQDWIEIESVHLRQIGPAPQVAAANPRYFEKRKPDAGDELTITRKRDKRSQELLRAYTWGTAYSVIEVHFCRVTQGRQVPFQIWKLHDVLITGISVSGDGAFGGGAMEEYSLAFREAAWKAA